MSVRLAAILVLLLLPAAGLGAQQGTLSARVTDAATARPLPSVQVGVSGGGVQTGGLTNENGTVRVSVAPGTYTVTFQLIGYATETVTGVSVTAGQIAEVGVNLESEAVGLDEMVITASRQFQKKTDAPATVSVISERTIEERPAATPVQHLWSAPGVDIIQQGIQSTNVVVRGFNNIFSGALHALTDNRIASIPSLRVNLLHFVPSTDDDLARMEVVLGPGSALYGPNTANGVLHIITKSPLAEQGTTVALAGGQQSFFKGMFRTSQLLTDDFGLKVSGQYMRADEWEFVDSTEVRARQRAQFVEAGLRAQGVPEADITLALSRLGVRDFQIERFSGELRGDWRVNEEATLVFQAGASNADGIELTGIGAGQTQGWLYSYLQTRFNWNRLFAQAYLNMSDAGDSYLVRQGAPLIDNSTLFVSQLQHGAAFGGVMADGQRRQDFTYGVDLFSTTPKTEGRINGQYEDDDEITELGAYLQSQTALTDQLDLVLAARVDHHSVLDKSIFSPRAALVFKPTEGQAVRATFNRAFSLPTTLNFFLDINGGLAQGLEGLGFFTRAQGPGKSGLSFQNADGSLRGVRLAGIASNLGLPVGQLRDANSQPDFFRIALVALLGQGAISQAQFNQLIAAAPAMAGVSLNLLDPIDRSVTPLASANLPDTPPLEESITETFEVGYQGVLNNRFSVAADAWYSKRTNFTSPLVVRTPLVLLSGPEVAQRLVAAGVPPATAGAVAAGVAQVPVAVVSSPDVQSSTADIVASYVNFGEVDLFGTDLAVKAFLTDNWTLEGTVSWVSDDFFVVRGDEEIEDFDQVEDVNEVLSLNAPDFKGSLALGYRDEAVGFTGEARMRFSSEFPVNSADFVGLGCLPGLSTGGAIRPCVESFQIVDLLLGYRVPGTGAQIQLNVQNVFDEPYQNFVGVPEIGRFSMLQLKYSF